MNSYDLAMDVIQEGRIHAKLNDVVNYFEGLNNDLDDFNDLTHEEVILNKEMENAGYSLDVRHSVLKFTDEAIRCISSLSEGQSDEVLTLVNIDYCEYEDEENLGSFHTNAILTFEDKNGNEISISVDTTDEWQKGNHWSEDKLLNHEINLSLLTQN